MRGLMEFHKSIELENKKTVGDSRKAFLRTALRTKFSNLSVNRTFQLLFSPAHGTNS
jgi:hypothetical protein